MKKNKPTDNRPSGEIYVGTHLYISNGSRDVVGGLAKVKKVTEGVSGGEKCLFVEVFEHPGHSYNWTQILSKEQGKLKKEFGKKRAYADPDIDTPWIQEGDFVCDGNGPGHIHHGPPVW